MCGSVCSVYSVYLLPRLTLRRRTLRMEETLQHPPSPAEAPAPVPRPVTARVGPRRREVALLGVALLVHLSLLGSWRLGYWDRFTFDSTATRGDRGWDLFAVYQAGRNVRDGVSAYETSDDAIDVVVPRLTPFRYLPVSAYTVGAALTLLSPLWAFRLWVAFVECVLLGCAYASWRRGGSGREGAVLAAMWLAFTPYYLEIYLGQFTLVQAALVYAMLLAWESGAGGWRLGVPWTLSLLWKQNTGLLAPLMLRTGRWRLVAAAGLAVLAASAPHFLRHPGALGAFLANFRSGPPGAQLGNLGVRQFLYSVAAALGPKLSPAAHSAIQNAWVALVLLVALWLTARRPVADPVPLACLWVTSYFLVYHHVWEHHYVLLLPVLVTLYRREHSPVVVALWALLAVWTPYILVDPAALAAYHMPMRWTPLEPAWVDVAYHASKALPATGLWAYAAWLSAGGTPARRPTGRGRP